MYSVKAHDAIVNVMDGCGGVNIGYGAPEIVTASRDGGPFASLHVAGPSSGSRGGLDAQGA